MKILSIETSCDETAVSVIEAEGGIANPKFKVLSNLVLSQIKVHEQYGGVFPNLAKREHAKNLIPLIEKSLLEADLISESNTDISPEVAESIKAKTQKEPELFDNLINFLGKYGRPNIDLIAVTSGPGLEPALWVGINAAKVLAKFWNVPVSPINHMEGHISSVLVGLESPVEFPAIALLISGGHTEFVLINDWLEYQVIGETRDDAVGEAYDKVARMLGLPYPGGSRIGAMAQELRSAGGFSRFNFPRPMINSGDFDFSFSGLKTAVLYTIKGIDDLDDKTKKEIALAFEEAVVDTLLAKAKKVFDRHGPKTLIVAGGVIANDYIRNRLQELASEYDIDFLVPQKSLSTDNALMIAVASYLRFDKLGSGSTGEDFVAEGNVKLS